MQIIIHYKLTHSMKHDTLHLGNNQPQHLVKYSMAHSSDNMLVQWLVIAMVITMLYDAQGVVFCNIDSNNINVCRAAVTGQHPPPPNRKCCALVRQANLPCLCSYKSVLPSIGINPKNALALPAKCGLRTPPGC
ncbi:putative bifunctional inhibitor/plant lipid transfer protein/seed storage helical [Lupinus albus]|nr:putative bifunctional inhibitor/plant lipid transfer protein/seed storage helical [Lupinus albus]KAE9584137.1 putative bifunctional inhibitor/plant lipid transfer protein/seed storage helical [Lupinus albus]